MAHELKYAVVNATADGDNEIIAAVAGKKIRVLSYVLTGASVGGGTVTLQDTAGTPVAHLKLAVANNGGFVYVGDWNLPAFETASGEGLEVNNPSGSDTFGRMTYLEV